MTHLAGDSYGKNKKILILYTSVGLGHKYLALNIAYHLEKAGYEIKLHDVLQLQEGPLVSVGEWIHSLINRRFPFIWRWLYMSKTFTDLTLPWRVPLAGRNNAYVKQVIDDFQPDCVISTQTTGSAIMSYLRRQGLYRGKFVIAFSDYHLHRYWLYDPDIYLVNTEQQAVEMKQLGVSQPIVICGITLRPLPPVDAAAVKHQLGIAAGKKVVLVSSGSLGIGFPVSLLQELIRQMVSDIPDVEVLVVCGKNEIMRQELEAAQLPATKVLGFYQPMAELYSVADLFLTKPGGLSTAEALQAGVPILITHWLPGQEELNYYYLTDRSLVNPMPDPFTTPQLVQSIKTLLSQPRGSETSESIKITQKNQEGEVVLKAISDLFHNV